MALYQSATHFQVLYSPARGHTRLPAGSQTLLTPWLLPHMLMAHKQAEVPKLAPQALKLHQLPLAALSHLQGFLHVQEEEATNGCSHMVKTSTVLHNLYEDLEERADGHSDPDLRAI